MVAGLPLRGVRVFMQFSWLEAGSGKVTLSRPIHQRITRAVRLLNNVSIQIVEIKLCCSGTSNPTTNLFPMI
jgi:hypothetical protein